MNASLIPVSTTDNVLMASTIIFATVRQDTMVQTATKVYCLYLLHYTDALSTMLT